MFESSCLRVVNSINFSFWHRPLVCIPSSLGQYSPDISWSSATFWNQFQSRLSSSPLSPSDDPTKVTADVSIPFCFNGPRIDPRRIVPFSCPEVCLKSIVLRVIGIPWIRPLVYPELRQLLRPSVETLYEQQPWSSLAVRVLGHRSYLPKGYTLGQMRSWA